MATKPALCVAFLIFAAIAFLWHLIAGRCMFLAVAGRLMVLHAADVDAAPQKLAFAGAVIAETIEVMSMATLLAFLEAEAILAANIAACIGMTYSILGAAAWTVLKDHTRLAALIADSITVRRLAAVVAQLFDDALLAALLMALVKDLSCMLVALVVPADLLADNIHAAMLAVHASALFCLIESLPRVAVRIGGCGGQSTREQSQGHQHKC